MHLPEFLYILAGQLRAELHGVIGVFEAGAGADHLEPFGWNSKPHAKAADEKRHLGAACSPVKVRLVDDQEEPFVGIGFKPLSRVVKYGPLQRAHEHVLKHGVIGYQHVGRSFLNLIA